MLSLDVGCQQKWCSVIKVTCPGDEVVQTLNGIP